MSVHIQLDKVHIQLDKDWAITSDEHSWHLCKYKKRTRDGIAQVTWEPRYHYGSLETLLCAEVERRVRTSDAKTFAQVLEEIDRAVVVITNALKPYLYTVEVIDGNGKVLGGGE
jgi:hypothetical protein